MPTSYAPPVAQLLGLGDPRPGRDWPDYPALGLGPEHVPELIRMATDRELNSADPESREVWAPLHAWRTLGQLQATAAIEPLLPLLEELEESDWAGEELPEVYGMIGAAAIPALAAYLANRAHNLWPRITAAHSLERIATHDPTARSACVAVLTHQLTEFAAQDPTLNAFLIGYLVDLKAVEAVPVIERAFAADQVDLFVGGDLQDVQVELGLKAARETPPLFRSLWPGLDMPQSSPTRTGPRTDKAAKAKTKRKQAKASRKQNRKRR